MDEQVQNGQTAVGAKDFIRAWMTSSTRLEVIEKLAEDGKIISPSACYSRYKYMEKRGVPLGSMPSGAGNPQNNWEELAKYAASFDTATA